MAKQTINIGATANDTSGDSIRAAFKKVNDNFAELYTISVNTVPTTSKGVAGDKAGTIVSDSTYFYICKANYTDGLADIWSRNPLASGTW